MRKRASGHRARQTLARLLSTGQLEVETKMKSSQKSLYLRPAHKEKNAVEVGRLSVHERMIREVRALGGAGGVHCVRADPGQVFRPDSAHLERAAEELEARFASQSSKLGALPGAPLPVSRKNMQTGESAFPG